MIANDVDVKFKHHLEKLKDGDDFVLPAGGRISTIEADPDLCELHVWWIEEELVDEDGEPLSEDDLPDSWKEAYAAQSEAVEDGFHDAIDDAWGGDD